MNRAVTAASAAIDMEYIRSIMIRQKFNAHFHADTLFSVTFIIPDDVL